MFIGYIIGFCAIYLTIWAICDSLLNDRPRSPLKTIFASYDGWTGYFWDGRKKRLYVFLLPWFGFVWQCREIIEGSLRVWTTGKQEEILDGESPYSMPSRITTYNDTRGMANIDFSYPDGSERLIVVTTDSGTIVSIGRYTRRLFKIQTTPERFKHYDVAHIVCTDTVKVSISNLSIIMRFLSKVEDEFYEALDALVMKNND